MNYADLQLHEIIRNVLDDNPKHSSPKQLAAKLGLSHFTLLKWGEDPDGSGSPIPAKYIIPFSELTGDHRVVEWFARQISRRTVALDMIKSGNGYISDELLGLDQIRGELSGVLLAALDDGKLSEDERYKLRELAAKMVEMLYVFQQELENSNVSFAKKNAKE